MDLMEKIRHYGKVYWALKIFFWGLVIVGIFSFAMVLGNSRYSKAKAEAYHVSPNIFEATVVTEPQELSGGIYLVMVEAGSPEKTTRYPALTSYPGWFKVGQKVKVENYMVSGTNALRDQFHIVYINIPYKENQGGH
jgi:hypothetical protein